jgi:folate-binding Fe-S cluster repair protein YgfZ
MELVEMTVDFSKGCYLGQELVARIDSRGHVNRFLRVLDLEQPVEEGSTITLGDLEAGVLTSVAGAQGLGLVRREVSPGDRVIVGGAVPAVVRAVTQG